jgi:hypothetical protein
MIRSGLIRDLLYDLLFLLVPLQTDKFYFNE